MNLDTSIIELKLPVPWFGFRIKRKIGFRFDTMAYAMMCKLFVPEIDFHQVAEISETKKDEVLAKLICGGAMSYAFDKKEKCIVTEKIIDWWIENLPGSQRDLFIDSVNCAILDGKVVGQKVSDLAVKKK